MGTKSTLAAALLVGAVAASALAQTTGPTSAAGAAAPAGAAQAVKVVYHINTGIDTAAAALNSINNHLNAAPNTRIVVVTHGPGIDFLLSDAKDGKGRVFSGTVSDLASRGVDFRVCNNTLTDRKIDPGRLLMEASVVPSGVAEVARLQAQEGYAYIKP
jgi:intracellular sulfur oxidation DsrE/DsrF family protein